MGQLLATMRSPESTKRLGTKLEVFQKLSESRQKQLYDGLLAIVLYFLAQLLIWGVDNVISLTQKDFPSPIVAMLLVWLVMVVLGWCWRDLNGFFLRYLKGPVWRPSDSSAYSC